MNGTRLQGNVPILATAFADDGTVDLDSISRLVSFLLEQKIDGLALFGNASEGYALTAAEKRAILERVREQTAGAIPLVVGAGGAGIEVAVENALWACGEGADALMVMPPSVVKPDETRLLEFYGELARRVSVPIMLQDAPGVSGVSMSVKLLARLCSENDAIRYVKVESPPTALKISALQAQLHGAAEIFGGLNGVYMFEELERGVTGVMPACEFPDVVNAILRAHAGGDREEARALFYRYLPFFRYGTQPGINVAVHKEVLFRSGVFATARVRNPNVPLDPATRGELFAMLEHLPLAILAS
ncbi:dihydrodipicolinate synthase family protein [Consotaella salsifontis]|uniref:2-dehydro-3-deoxy-L-arabinonate dehydratase n=1 Tax=Consotaella salsifontis TaxID=1365950 RepID=A0A1T4S3A8_9HYPH|nr:dihydrodipicolinate synthase family protein [Consotaella salsifontis]SKA22438.1 2-dehydro-3-deoxy-L-arabinonate dehydratase [Consotaella salsifontis]